MRLRILTVADVSPLVVYGGAERVLWEQVSRLAAEGHDVRVVSRTTRPDVCDTERDRVVVRHFRVEPRGVVRFFLSSITGARRLVATELHRAEADVIHFHQPLSAFGVLTSPVGRRLPSLYTFHSAAPLEYRWRRRSTRHHLGGVAGILGVSLLWAVERTCVRRATRIHALSRFSAGQLQSLYAVPLERIAIEPGGVDTARFAPAADRARIRKDLGLPFDRPLLLTVRNLEARMGLDALVHAMSLLRRTVPDALLLIGGAGPLEDALAGLVTSLGLSDTVRLLGFVPEAHLARYYQAADLFVLPTRALEGFGLVTVEALACGTPVIGTAIGATPEVLTPIDPMLVVPEPTAGALATALSRWIDAQRSDPGAAEALRRRCRAVVESRYAWADRVHAIAEELGRLARMRATPSPSARGCAEPP